MDKEKEGKKIISIDLEDGDEEDDEDDDTSLSNSENSNSQSENGTIKTAPKRKRARAEKDLLSNSITKFMSNFDPELSNRERRKLTRKINVEGKKNGTLSEECDMERDVCDCLQERCPGCHFPCPKCRSCKCGIECRVNRKWMYEGIENEAEATVTKNAVAPVTPIGLMLSARDVFSPKL